MATLPELQTGFGFAVPGCLTVAAPVSLPPGVSFGREDAPVTGERLLALEYALSA
jgi:hypothetical protein